MVLSAACDIVLMPLGSFNLKNIVGFIRFLNDLFVLQDVYCLNADGSLFDAALLSAVAAFTHCKDHFKTTCLC